MGGELSFIKKILNEDHKDPMDAFSGSGGMGADYHGAPDDPREPDSFEKCEECGEETKNKRTSSCQPCTSKKHHLKKQEDREKSHKENMDWNNGAKSYIDKLLSKDA